MTNFAIVVVIAAFICATNVHVYADDNDNGNNPSFFGLDMQQMQQEPITFPPFKMLNLTFPPIKFPNPSDIINLKPKDNNTKVSGTYSSFSSNVQTKDGHIVSQSASAKNIDNKNGNVTEQDASY